MLTCTRPCPGSYIRLILVLPLTYTNPCPRAHIHPDTYIYSPNPSRILSPNPLSTLTTAAPAVGVPGGGSGGVSRDGSTSGQPIIDDLANEQTVIPNLAAYVTVNPSIQFFVTNPAQRRMVALAVDRAIREIIQPVVERSVTIASVTTKQILLKGTNSIDQSTLNPALTRLSTHLIISPSTHLSTCPFHTPIIHCSPIPDFATEPSEQQLRSGAHLMISNLAGSLALVTCKEPLRVSISNHLRSFLLRVTQDQTVIEQIVQLCSTENLELGCMLIEKVTINPPSL